MGERPPQARAQLSISSVERHLLPQKIFLTAKQDKGELKMADETLDLINNLVQTCKDGETGYLHAAGGERINFFLCRTYGARHFLKPTHPSGFAALAFRVG